MDRWLLQKERIRQSLLFFFFSWLFFMLLMKLIIPSNKLSATAQFFSSLKSTSFFNFFRLLRSFERLEFFVDCNLHHLTLPFFLLGLSMMLHSTFFFLKKGAAVGDYPHSFLYAHIKTYYFAACTHACVHFHTLCLLIATKFDVTLHVSFILKTQKKPPHT